MSQTAPFPIVNGQYKMDREPEIRIGVILREDERLEAKFALPREGYKLVAGSDEVTIGGSVKADFSVRVSGERLDLVDPAGTHVFRDVENIRVIPPADAPPAAQGSGIHVRDIVSGRGFHWYKLIDQTLTGKLEFVPSGRHIIMVNELPLEEYLVGVITGEMSGECPLAFLKAQTVAARSWLLAQPESPHPGEPFIWCNDDDCQRYQGTGGWSDRAFQAVRETRGEVLITASNKYCDARYSKNTGGVSEDAYNIWYTEIEGLVSRLDAPADSYAARFSPVTEENLVEYLTGDWLKECTCYASPNVISEEELPRYLGRVDEPGSYFRWTVPVTQESLRESLTQRAGIEDLNDVLDLRPLRRGKSGRLNKLAIDYLSTSGEKKAWELTSEYDIRAGMWTSFLYSGAFILTDRKNAGNALESVTLRGGGWGHGAGLCQIGGLGRALSGQEYYEILGAYFTGVRLERIYD